MKKHMRNYAVLTTPITTTAHAHRTHSIYAYFVYFIYQKCKMLGNQQHRQQQWRRHQTYTHRVKEKAEKYLYLATNSHILNVIPSTFLYFVIFLCTFCEWENFPHGGMGLGVGVLLWSFATASFPLPPVHQRTRQCHHTIYTLFPQPTYASWRTTSHRTSYLSAAATTIFTIHLCPTCRSVIVAALSGRSFSTSCTTTTQTHK